MPNFNDPLTSLSFALHQGPGQFAVLLGSGISRSAGIPTGWGVTLDLVRKLPKAPQDVSDDALIAWYEEAHGDSPSYSSLVGGLANSEVERRNLLGPYFEPTEEEREEGLKMPTKAHRAIAKMVVMGLLRVIITTNFDRLMERALADEGITADVVNHESGIAGAMPYAHSKCLVIKVHGDYVDTRLRNTEEELFTYPPELRSYLLHILDEHGLLVCGWSADYDAALVEVITSSPNRRFGMYWMHTAPLSAIGTGVVEARRGTLVEIESADAAFESLQQRVETLRELSRPRPLDVATVVASAKRYIPRPEHRIQLSDLVSEEIEGAMKIFESEEFNLDPPNARTDQGFVDEYRSQVGKYEAASIRICALASTLSYYGDVEQMKLVVRILNKLARPEQKNFNSTWTELRYYPAFLVLYSAGSAAMAAERESNAATILREPTSRYRFDQEDTPLIQNLVGYKVLGDQEAQYLYSTVPTIEQRRFAPVDDHLVEVLPGLLSWLHISAAEAKASYSSFHYLLQLAYIDQDWEADHDRVWAPLGQYYLFRFMGEAWKEQPQSKIETRLLGSSNNALIEAGLFRGDHERLKAITAKLKDFLIEAAKRAH